MAYKKIRNNIYIADTVEDLKLIKETDIGASCKIIKEASEYKLMSTGEWVKQIQSSSTITGGTEIDTSNFATKTELKEAVDSIQIPSIEGLASETYVNEAVNSIQIPSIEGLASETYVNEAVNSTQIPSIEGLASETYVNEAIAKIETAPALKMFEEDPVIMESNPGSKFGIALNNGDARTLPEEMLAKGGGMYNCWIHKSKASLPTEVLEKKSSCRGICCVDTVKDTGWYGWILMYDQDGDVYTQYIRNAEPRGWKRLVTI